ncbi:MAG TPA: O-methyltransferase [Candidatus Thermoplasmatota archaeon]|nr:O-methyltransferase [Candidatus Thermoplasmatota archaeon]
MDVDDRVERYLDSLVHETAAMRKVREASAAEELPHLRPASAQLLAVVARAVGARRALEVGCCLGYSALWLAEAVGPDGEVDTIEADEELARRAREHFRDARAAARVRVHVGRALDVLPVIEGAFDVCFLDADKREYVAYLEHAMRLVRPGGLIVADNALWSGRVADPVVKDADTLGVRAYNRRVANDVRLATAIVPVGDGVAVSVILPR